MTMLGFVSAIVGAKVQAFITEFGMLLGAAACLSGALVVLSVDPAKITRWPFVGAIVRSCRAAVAGALFAAALLLFGEYDGFRRARALDASADLRAQLEAKAAIDTERDRREAIYRNAFTLSVGRADALARDKAELQTKIKESDDASRLRDSVPCLDARGLQRLDAIR